MHARQRKDSHSLVCLCVCLCVVSGASSTKSYGTTTTYHCTRLKNHSLHNRLYGRVGGLPRFGSDHCTVASYRQSQEIKLILQGSTQARETQPQYQKEEELRLFRMYIHWNCAPFWLGLCWRPPRVWDSFLMARARKSRYVRGL